MKKNFILNILVTTLISFTSCASSNNDYLYSKQYKATDIISIPKVMKDTYGYLFMAHKSRTRVFGVEPDVFESLVLDNCRKAGIYYTDTFAIVKLLPGNHRIRII